MEKTPHHIDWANLLEGFIVDKKYRVIRPLIKGSGGSVYEVEEID
jgi:hypothetical protein